MVMTVAAVLLGLCALGSALYGAASDFMRLRIPNQVSLVLILSFFPALFLSGHGAVWLFYLLPAAVIFVISYILFSVGVFGGGDSKMMAAIALWVGLKALPLFLLLMSFAGGVLAVLAIVIGKQKLFTGIKWSRWICELHNGRKPVPYGVAIAFGGIWASLSLGFGAEILSDLKSLFYVPA